ncbi:histidine--tRNA ligase [Candidatus Rariloculus sp.]|uniref:histidine--tRNA ligase n=1 Tax=Candidatus Rariloculus sp. TaxID=3101265 RepID=UPI003D0A8233
MAELIQPVRGMNDILPDEEALWALVESAVAELFERYGYRRIRTPVLEKTELFRRSIGELTDIVEKEMYTFQDRNGDSLTMRPEATASIVRACLSNGLLHNQQRKLWCSGPMFRHEKPQRGRYRQFHQINIEALGHAEPEVDAELIVISARLWEKLGVRMVLEMNSLGTPESRTNYKRALVDYFGKRRSDLDADSIRRLERNPMRILDSKNPAMRELVAEAPVLADYLDSESRDHFECVKTLLSDVDVGFTVNPRLVRGLDYYTRTVFEWISDALGAQSAVCSGGRYDGLVSQLGGNETPCVGWALGVERVIDLMRVSGWDGGDTGPDVYVVAVGSEARRKCFSTAERLRARVPDLTLVMGRPGGFKAQLRRADKSGARYALIVGDDELAAGKLSVKPLREDGAQQLVDFDELVTRLGREVGTTQ